MRYPVLFIATVFALLSTHSLDAQLYINEFMASNNNSITDASGTAEDWIEIYNAGAAPVNLAGYYISDDLGDPLTWQIPDTDPATTTVPAGGFIILWADKDTDDGANHVDIKLSSDGEDLVLTAPDGTTVVDSYTYSTQTTDISFGRIGDGAATWDFFAEPTPGASNDTEPGAPSLAPPEFSISGGYYTGDIQITLSVEAEDAEIRYTTDGSVPTEDDPVYDGPITVSTNTPLRARAFLAPLVPSVVKTETYLFNINHTFPVVAYTADPEEMFGEENGMYTNYTEDIEINVNAEFYEPDGTQGFNQQFESEINGTGSAVAPQKSVALKAKKSLGSETIDYPIFPTSDRDTYRSLILRNSGQDNNITHFRDVMASSLVLDVSDLNADQPTILPPRLFGQQYRPGVTYINGAYWGIMNIRERSDKRYIKNVFDLDDDEIDLLENLDEVKEGDLETWNELFTFLENNSLADQSNFDYVASQIALDHYADYVIFNLYIDNQDWPGNNDRRFRERVDEAQWRWLTYDLDFSFGLFVPGQPWNSGYNQSNSLNRLLVPNSYFWPNPEYATLLFRRLVENDQWRTQFNNRMADQLNLLFNDERVIGRIDGFQSQYAPEMQQHIDRWIQWLDWPSKVQLLRNFADGRDDIVRSHFVEAFEDISGVANLTVNLNSGDQGSVQLNTISIHQNNAPFTGKYFTGIDIPVSAHPNRGYVLESWSGALSGADTEETLNINADASITANFSLGSTSTANIVINEINYNSSDDMDSGDWVELYNPNAEVVDISGWYFEDESGRFFGIPANTILAANQFLLLVEDQDAFEAIYPQVNNILGNFGAGENGFGLSGGGELITIKNATGVLIDAVEYDDKAPWPTEPDGNGPTLQLISPDLDNSLASSWTAFTATPGAPNSDGPPVNSIQINCPSSFSVTLLGGQNSIVVNWPLPEVTNSCPQGNFTLVQTNGPANGSSLTAGDYQISYEASNDCNDEANCSFFISVKEQESSLEINCPASIAVTIPAGQNSTVVNWSAPQVINSCPQGNATVVQTNGPVNGAALSAGNYQVSYQATNPCGDEANCNLFITVSAEESNLEINCPVSFSVTIPAGENSAVANWSAPQVDNSCSQGNATVVQTSGPDNGAALTAGDYQVSYLASNPCNDEDECSFFITVINQPISNAYCDSDADFPWHDWISNVKVADIDKASGKSTYSDFTAFSTSLNIGNTYDAILTTGYSWTTYPSYWRVWIDFNQNGIFTDPGEMVVDKLGTAPPNGTPNAITNDVFTVPQTALTGSTRMRVIMRRNNPPDPCGTYPFGETEDYTVQITNQENNNYSPGSAAEQQSFRIFPNPVMERATLVVDVEGAVQEITVYNKHGQTVELIRNTNWQNVYYLQTQTWMPGMYFIRMNMADGRSWTKKIMVIKE